MIAHMARVCMRVVHESILVRWYLILGLFTHINVFVTAVACVEMSVGAVASHVCE